MSKRGLGQLILIVGIIMTVIAGASIWFNWLEQGISAAIFLIALILVGAGTYLSKRRDKR